MAKVGSNKEKRVSKAEAPLPLTYPMRMELAGLPLDHETRERLGLVLKVPAYAQDPDVAIEHPEVGIIDLDVAWRPGITDGPTSARVAVVDYDGDVGKIYDPAIWNEKELRFEYPTGKALCSGEMGGKDTTSSYQFHQVGVWATIEHALALYEDRIALGRALPWGFTGNRLIVVPHAGQDENAYYDRSTKSLQFYYVDSPNGRVYTCLSHDIVAHETGHAILDGIRPLYIEVASPETAAFHEFVADLTQLLSALRVNSIRHAIGKTQTGKELDTVDFLSKVGEQFAKSIYGERDSIRDLAEFVTLKNIEAGASPHRRSQVLTNALFRIMLERERDYRKGRGKTELQSLWNTIYRLMQIALQPLDYCPPVDIRFEDYTAALLCRDQLLSPCDEHGYRRQMLKIFEERGVKCPVDESLNLVEKLARSLDGVNFFNMATSRVAIYRFLHQQRKVLGIPSAEDLIVLEPYISSKSSRDASNLPRELVIQYLWREPVQLEGKRYGPLKGERAALLCGGTLLFNENGRLLYASLKPGTQPSPDKPKQDAPAGEKRREELTKHLASLIEQDALAFSDETQFGHLGAGLQAIAHRDAFGLRLEAAPRLHSGTERNHWRSQ